MAAMSCRARAGGDDRAGGLCRSFSSSSSSDCSSGGGFRSRSWSNSSSFASSASAAFSSPPSAFLHRSTSPTRVNLLGRRPPSPASSVRCSIDRRAASPVTSFAVGSPRQHHVDRDQRRPVGRPTAAATRQKRVCMCSPTTHPGSFRCSLHKGGVGGSNHSAAGAAPSNRLNARRSAMANSLVRIGAVEGGEWVRRALTALIRPSSHQQRRRAAFQPRPSRLSIMSMAGDDV